ncbi:2-amino-4-hydroxy-6-hydroxymethyldihydropteridine diphosphokinase [Breoghania corrubedonensis]|uniref:2-amino-4-hydroxy-6-hydroxymethyldihydropteridine pyrophosphokinase n=1 Tax=Breoghania corrubedonensis TaxID=665038 RepID=A0A2T5VH62_9HYPH|nr:2-amino-4-hydroxy-6-hydroxymethyldihydropteridine diphosphokinase [Breoghania corrubedonensis]PTW63090.1 2-amino-4-hydroxy-6-hydroxymethyldihydropteridine diphosphokinase [Breoghania corrubedonensis]
MKRVQPGGAPDNPSAREPVRVALGLGSNIGDKRAFVRTAIEQIAQSDGITVVARSADYRTAPWGLADQDWFVNACIVVETTLSAEDLLARALEIERRLGRVRDIRWGPRKIDIDVLVYAGEEIAEEGLSIPHPRIAERAFVLVPLAEIWPDAPVGGGLTAAGALAACTDADTIEMLRD